MTLKYRSDISALILLGLSFRIFFSDPFVIRQPATNAAMITADINLKSEKDEQRRGAREEHEDTSIVKPRSTIECLGFTGE